MALIVSKCVFSGANLPSHKKYYTYFSVVYSKGMLKPTPLCVVQIVYFVKC